MFRTLLLITLLMILLGCNASHSINEIDQPQGDEIYEVYSAALVELFGKQHSDQVIRISNRTEFEEIPTRLEARFSVAFEYELVNADQLRRDSENLRPEEWLMKYPKFSGLVLLSPVVFDFSHNNASVRVDYVMCPLCGFGTTLYLRREQNSWRVIRREDGWIS